MAFDRIRHDLMYLSGRLPHRGAQSHEERAAAEFLRERFKEYTPDVEFDEFHAFESYPQLFASYYGEFIVVALLAIWWPLAALCYGAVAFVAYLAEFQGYPVFSRLLPAFETQNVIARFLGARPNRLVIIAAYYDSGCASALSDPGIVRLLRPLCILAVLCMAVVLAACAVDAFAPMEEGGAAITGPVRWTGAAILVLLAGSLYLSSMFGEDVRGANANGSGVCGLLRIAEALRECPLEDADVWLVAAGSHEAWMSGIRHFLTTHHVDKRHMYLLNLEAVGIGRLHYLRAEGMLHREAADPELLAAAEQEAAGFGASPAVLRAVPTLAHIPLARGCRAMTIMRLDEHGLPARWNSLDDRAAEVDEEAIAQAADFAEAVMRRVAAGASAP